MYTHLSPPIFWFVSLIGSGVAITGSPSDNNVSIVCTARQSTTTRFGVCKNPMPAYFASSNGTVATVYPVSFAICSAMLINAGCSYVNILFVGFLSANTTSMCGSC